MTGADHGGAGPRVCIATGDYYRPGETFINRHIAHLFGGAACVVVGRFDGIDPLGKPIFVRRRRGGARDFLTAPLGLAVNRYRHGTSRIPVGRARADLEAFLRAHGVEVILAEFGTQALALSPVANGMGVPIFSYFRGTDASKALRSRKIVAAYRKMMPRLAGVLSVSQFLLDNLAAHDIHPPNAHVLPSGVDVARFRPAEKRPESFVAVGRFIEKKAPEVTLRSFAQATADRPGARLTMIGDGPLLERCRDLAAGLGLAGKVELPGALPHEEVRARLAGAAVFLQHSLTGRDGNTEGMPTAIQEALACGCPVVSTRHAGIPEAVDEGATGFLVEEGDAAGFAAAIARMLGADTEAMGRRAREAAVARFDNAKLLARLEEIIRETLAGGTGRLQNAASGRSI